MVFIVVWISVFIAIVLLAVLVWRLSFDWGLKTPQAPLYGWTIPFAGIAIQLLSAGPNFLIDLCKKSPMYRMYMGGYTFYFVTDVNYFNSFYKTSEHVMSFYRGLEVFKLSRIIDQATMIAVEDGNIAIPLFKKNFIPAMKSYLPNVHTAVYNYCANMGNEGRFDDFAIAATKMAIDISVLTFAGERVYNNKTFLEKLLKMENLARKVVPAMNKEKLFDEIVAQRTYLKEKLEEELQYRKDNKIERNDLLHILTSEGDFKTQVARSTGFFFAVLANTQATLAWAMTCILQYPDVKRRVTEEADSIPYPYTWEDLNKTQIIDAAIKETLRYLIAVPFHFRVSGEDSEYKGYHIPKNSLVAVSPYVQMRGSCYPNPHQFDLNNFLGNDKITQNDFLTFGIGKHKCVGRPFAEIMMKEAILTWLRDFSWKVESKIPKPDYVGSLGIPWTAEKIVVSYKRRSLDK